MLAADPAQEELGRNTERTKRLRELVVRIWNEDDPDEKEVDNLIEEGVLDQHVVNINFLWAAIRETKGDFDRAVLYCDANLNLLHQAQWSPSEITIDHLEPYLRTRLVQVLPTTDDKGRTIAVFSWGALQINGAYTAEDYSKACLWWAHYMSRNTNALDNGMVAFWDFTGFSLAKFKKCKMADIQRIKLFENTCPPYLSEFYMVNVPWYLRIINALMPAKFKTRVHVISRNKICEIVPPDRVTPDVGGTLQFDPGDIIDRIKRTGIKRLTGRVMLKNPSHTKWRAERPFMRSRGWKPSEPDGAIRPPTNVVERIREIGNISRESLESQVPSVDPWVEIRELR